MATGEITFFSVEKNRMFVFRVNKRNLFFGWPASLKRR